MFCFDVAPVARDVVDRVLPNTCIGTYDAGVLWLDEVTAGEKHLSVCFRSSWAVAIVGSNRLFPEEAAHRAFSELDGKFSVLVEIVRLGSLLDLFQLIYGGPLAPTRLDLCPCFGARVRITDLKELGKGLWYLFKIEATFIGPKP